MENDFLSFIGAIGAIATVIALFTEKSRMSFLNFLKQEAEQFFNLICKMSTATRLAFILKISRGNKAGTFQIKRLKPIYSVTITRGFPAEYTILEISYRPQTESYPFNKITANMPIYEAALGDYRKSGEHVLRGAFDLDLAIDNNPSLSLRHSFSDCPTVILLVPSADISGLQLTVSGPFWLPSQTLKV